MDLYNVYPEDTIQKWNTKNNNKTTRSMSQTNKSGLRIPMEVMALTT
jgi:hypothetical protein